MSCWNENFVLVCDWLVGWDSDYAWISFLTLQIVAEIFKCLCIGRVSNTKWIIFGLWGKFWNEDTQIALLQILYFLVCPLASTTEITVYRKIWNFSPKTSSLSILFNYSYQMRLTNNSYLSDKFINTSDISNQEILWKPIFGNFDFGNALKVFSFKVQKSCLFHEIL